MMNSSADRFLYLTTTGRKTGLPREIEISFVEFDARLYILAEHGYKAHWVRNILANPQVHVRIGNQQWQGTARVLAPHNDADTYLKVRELSRQKNGWGDGLPVEIRLGE
jgi:deazaflavin-dependent oxidoreductase (nitroreductase family)